jgi:NNP family nitrate/nitrite transporter-like MFS transporter
LGGWVSDKLGGAKVTQWDTIVMIIATLGVAFYVRQASGSDQPEEFFLPFLILFLILFITTGIGNGSTFRMVPIIFKPSEAGPVLGWTSAVAAYGAFIIPRVFGQQVDAGTPEYALYGFAIYYFSCLVLNWYYYARRNAEIKA